jgi:hypothetical protein
MEPPNPQMTCFTGHKAPMQCLVLSKMQAVHLLLTPTLLESVSNVARLRFLPWLRCSIAMITARAKMASIGWLPLVPTTLRALVLLIWQYPRLLPRPLSHLRLSINRSVALLNFWSTHRRIIDLYHHGTYLCGVTVSPAEIIAVATPAVMHSRIIVEVRHFITMHASRFGACDCAQ